MTAKVNESDHTLVESLSASLRKWMPRCEFCDCFATRQQTWSDRGPLYFCCSETCATKARACYDEDNECDQYGLEIYDVKWKETAMILDYAQAKRTPNPKVLRSPLGGDMEQPVVGGA